MKSFRGVLVVLAIAPFFFVNGQEVINPIEENEGMKHSSLWDAASDLVRKVGAAPHVVGGKEVVPHSHPYQASIFISYVTEYSVGGVLIAPEWVLTTAHEGSQGSYVVLGTHHFSYNESDQSITVWRAFQHTHYNNKTYANDIALLKLMNPAKLDQFVQPIRLPAVSQQNRDYTGSKVTLVGWGVPHTEDTSEGMTPFLQSFETTVVDNNTCAHQLFKSSLWASHICTDGQGGKGGCTNDGGGPVVMMEQDGKPTLVGVIQRVYKGLCDSSKPTVSVRVDKYLDFISETAHIPLRK